MLCAFVAGFLSESAQMGEIVTACTEIPEILVDPRYSCCEIVNKSRLVNDNRGDAHTAWWLADEPL